MVNSKFKKSRFGTLSDGKKVHIYTVSNGKMSFSATDFGCTVTSILIPGKDGFKKDVVLGHSTLAGYVNDNSCFGTAVGRFANRIGGGAFSLGGKLYELDKNDSGVNCLHGGFDRYEKKVWKASKIKTEHGIGIEFTRFSPAGEQGFPGNAQLRVIYTLNDENELTFEYFVKTDSPTPVNLTNHSYFNLDGRGTVENHFLKLNSSAYLEVNDTLVPTGKKISVDEDSDFDFREFKRIGQDIKNVGRGYDHAFMVDGWGDGKLHKIAVMKSEETGISMTVSTTQPAAQVYTANFLEGTVGKFGRVYHNHDALCIETEGYPDAPNHADFPDCIVTPEKPYHEVSVYRFDFN